MSSPPPSTSSQGWEEAFLTEAENFHEAQVVPPLQSILEDTDELEPIEPVQTRKSGYDQQSKLATDIEQARALATTLRKELEGAKILQRTSSTLKQELPAMLKSLADTTSGVSEAMEEAGWTRSSAIAERERYEKLIASSKEQSLKFQDLLQELDDQVALKSQTERAQQTSSALKSLVNFALARSKTEPMTDEVGNDLVEAAAKAEPYITNAGFKSKILQWRADLKIESTLIDVTSCEILGLVFLAHEDPAKLTSNKLSVAVEQVVAQGEVDCYVTALVLALLERTVVCMVKKLRRWEEDNLLFGLRALQLLSYHYPEASFLDRNELKGLLQSLKTKMSRSQIEHTYLVYGLEDMLEQRLGEHSNGAGENLATYIQKIAKAKEHEVPGLSGENFLLMADGNDLLLLTYPILKSAVRILKDGTFYITMADDALSVLLFIPNLLEEGKTWEHTLQIDDENWYAAYLPKACDRFFNEI